jgi:hypothetical protein
MTASASVGRLPLKAIARGKDIKKALIVIQLGPIIGYLLC